MTKTSAPEIFVNSHTDLSDQQESNLLSSLLQKRDMSLTDKQVSLLLQHLHLVLIKNQHLNLTRIENLTDGIIKHILDSLIPLQYVPLDQQDKHIRFLDIGTGAGFPGIPIGISTCWQGTLLDSVQKKINAVHDCIIELELQNLEAKSLRVEDYAKQQQGVFDLVIARAVADTSVLMEYASPLLSQGGYLCVLKAQPEDLELHNAAICEQLTGLKSVSRETYTLPDSNYLRTVLIYQKNKDATVKLPRKPGMALKRPLYKYLQAK